MNRKIGILKEDGAVPQGKSALTGSQAQTACGRGMDRNKKSFCHVVSSFNCSFPYN
jgi:hypothetical protein